MNKKLFVIWTIVAIVVVVCLISFGVLFVREYRLSKRMVNMEKMSSANLALVDNRLLPSPSSSPTPSPSSSPTPSPSSSPTPSPSSSPTPSPTRNPTPSPTRNPTPSPSSSPTPSPTRNPTPSPSSSPTPSPTRNPTPSPKPICTQPQTPLNTTDSGSCRKTDKCDGKLTIACVDNMNIGSANCDQDTCTIGMSKADCKSCGLNVPDTSGTVFINGQSNGYCKPVMSSPPTIDQIEAYCRAEHEEVHASQDPDSCPSCRQEAEAYNQSKKCYSSSYESNCKVVDSSNRALCDHLSSRTSLSQQFSDATACQCLPANRVKGEDENTKSGCAKCAKKISDPAMRQRFIDLYCPWGTPGGSPPTRSLSYGSSGEDVRYLQNALNLLGFTVASQGPGSRGNETTYFGNATKGAVIRFQETYNTEILSPVGLVRGNGYVTTVMWDLINTQLNNLFRDVTMR